MIDMVMLILVLLLLVALALAGGALEANDKLKKRVISLEDHVKVLDGYLRKKHGATKEDIGPPYTYWTFEDFR